MANTAKRRLNLTAIASHRFTSKFKSAAIAATSISIATLLAGIHSLPANAQAAYGSYIGVGGSLGVTDGSDNEDRSAGGVITGRYSFVEVPISIRAQALISERTAIVPMVSYDIPLNWYTDAYIGVGAVLQDGGESNRTSPLGNKTSFAIQPGIDHTLPDTNIVLFGNAVIAFDAYRENSGTAASIQGGVGLQF
jgi:hypothetical protein